MANLVCIYEDRKMSQKKLFITKSFKNKTILDSLLWFIENYLPQKKKRSSHSELRLNKFESIKIKKIKNLFSALSKSLKGDLRNSKVTLIVGNWASPYLNLLKKIKLLK
tara:strand:- start:429 stop:755 length:327 start_codon:yes stop_codon:yes gene_type:complete